MSYTSPQLAFGNLTSTQRTRYKIRNMETFIYTFKKGITRPFPLTTTHPIILPSKKKKKKKEKIPKLLNYCPCRQPGKGVEEIYHTSGPPCFIIYLQIPAKNWVLDEITKNVANIYTFKKCIYMYTHTHTHTHTHLPSLLLQKQKLNTYSSATTQ